MSDKPNDVKILPCPWCSSEQAFADPGDFPATGAKWRVTCLSCSARGDHYVDKETAVKSWNIIASLRAERDALKADQGSREEAQTKLHATLDEARVGGGSGLSRVTSLIIERDRLRAALSRTVDELCRTREELLMVQRKTRMKRRGDLGVRFNFVFEPRDLWVGAYWDKKKRQLFILPIPCFGIMLQFGVNDGMYKAINEALDVKTNR